MMSFIVGAGPARFAVDTNSHPTGRKSAAMLVSSL